MQNKTNLSFFSALGLMLSSIFLSFPVFSQPYCLPTYNSQCTSGDFIQDFIFNTINNTNTGCSNPGPNNYTDYTSSISTTVTQGQTYSVTCKPGPSWGQYFVLFIDFNQDFDFDDPGEFFDIGYAGAGVSITTSVNIPNGVMAGTTRLRVLCRYSTSALTQASACATGLSFGEVEDYTLIIGSALAVAQIDATTYSSLQEALDAAADDDEIMLLQDIAESNLVISNSVILNAGAFTLTASGLTIPPNKYIRWLTNTLTIPTGSSINNMGTLWNNGTIIHTDPYSNPGSHKGTGTFNGNFINNGTVNPGN